MGDKTFYKIEETRLVDVGVGQKFFGLGGSSPVDDALDPNIVLGVWF
jgi:hypothetical protein